MFGFPDGDKCPIDMSCNAVTPEELRSAVENAFEWCTQSSLGGPLRSGAVLVDRDSVESFFAHADGSIYDHALTPDDVNWQYSRAKDTQPKDQRIVVNKTTHRVRFENETENEVTVVIEPKSRE